MDKNVTGQGSKDNFKNTPNVGSTMGADKNANSSINSGSMSSNSSSMNSSSNMNAGGMNASGIASSVTGALGDARTAISDKAAPAMDYLKNNFSTVRDSSQVYIDDAEALIKRHPFYTVLGAAAIGAVVGMFMSRSASSVRANV